MQTQMMEDEKEWQDEFGVLPADSTKSSKARSSSEEKGHTGKVINLTEFSGILGDTSYRDRSSNMSMGGFFLKRCEDVRDMIPAISPTKRHKPVSLLHDSCKSGIIIYATKSKSKM